MSNPASLSAVQIRRATPGDADICGHICYEAFAAISRQHTFPNAFPAPEAGIGLMRMLFSHAGFYCVVAESDGRIVGSNCMDERSTVAGIGPITVAPDAQNRSVGQILMHAVLDRARERAFPGIRLLQAAYHNRSLSLYTKLGFDSREPISVMQGSPLKRTIEGCAVRPARDSDMDAANHVCERVHGHSRSGELRDAIVQGTALVVERHGRVTGYATEFAHYGHAVAE